MLARRGLSSLCLPFHHASVSWSRRDSNPLFRHAIAVSSQVDDDPVALTRSVELEQHGRQESNPVLRSWKPLGRHGLVRVVQLARIELASEGAPQSGLHA